MAGRDRRTFLKSTLKATGLLVAGPSLVRALDLPGGDADADPEPPATTLPPQAPSTSQPLPPPPRSATARVPLGTTGITASLLAQGTGTSGWNHTSRQQRLGREAGVRLIRHGLERGINLLDMADLYGSHALVREALSGTPRDAYVVLTKVWPRQEAWMESYGDSAALVDRFRREIGVDRIDVCLIHSVITTEWPEQHRRIRDELSRLKARGVIGAVGVSCHDLGALRIAAVHPWVDVVLARINHRGGAEFSMDGPADTVAGVLKEARARGKGVVGMKLFGAGRLVAPAEKDASLRYVLRGGLVDGITVGMTSPEEVDDAIERINRALQAEDRTRP